MKSQMWFPGMQKCRYQEGAGRRWYSAIVIRDLGDSFFDVDVEGIGRRVGTTDREREYPGYVKITKRRCKG